MKHRGSETAIFAAVIGNPALHLFRCQVKPDPPRKWLAGQSVNEVESTTSTSAGQAVKERHQEMTSEEMERAIEFLLQSQARTNEQVEALARTHAEFTQFVRSNLEAQSELNQSLRETVRALTIAQARTDERLSDLESNGNAP